MNITITINTDNAAFDDWHGGELRSILAAIADGIEAGRYAAEPPNPAQLCTANESFGENGARLLDSNGNTCGSIKVTP